MSDETTQYAIKITYTGDTGMLPGEALTTYLKERETSTIGMNPYNDLFCHDIPSRYYEKLTAVDRASTYRTIWHNARVHNRVFDQFIDMELFFRVVVWDELKFEQEKIMNEELKSKKNKQRRAIQKENMIYRIKYPERYIEVIDHEEF